MNNVFTNLVWKSALALLLAGSLVTAPAADNSAPVHTLDGSFVREWLVLGPFPSRDMETDFLADAGGEANIRPKEGDTVRTKDGMELIWTRLRSAHDIVDLEQVFGSLQWSVAYVYCEVDSAEPAATETRVAALPPAALWFNGVSIGLTPNRRSISDSPPALPIQVNRGKNACLLKLRFELEPPYAFAFQPLPPQRSTAGFQTKNREGRPVSGALIQFFDQGELVASLPTDSLGKAEISLYPLAASYEVSVTTQEMGTWLSALSLRPGEHRKFELALQSAVSISGKVLAMDGSPQTAIVVQALCVAPDSVAGATQRPAGPLQTGFFSAPRINSADEGQPKGDGSASSTVKAQSVLPMPPFSQTVLSDTNGNFQFVNLRPGRYQLRAHGARGYVYPEGEKNSDSSPAFEVAPGRVNDGVRFVFPEAKKGVWTSLRVKKGMLDLSLSAVHRTPDGMLWIGTNPRALYGYDGVEFKAYSDLPGLYARTIAHDAAGAVWIATDGGISRLANGQIQSVPLNVSHPGSDVRSIEADADGAVWFSTCGGLYKYDGRQLLRWSVKEGAPSSAIGALLRARDGGLWMSTRFSLARFDGQRFAEPVLLSGLRGAAWEKLYQAKDGALWFSSAAYENGAYRYDGKTLFRLGKQEGLASDVVSRVAETSDGVLWLATGDGLSRFDGTTILNYTPADGLGAGEVRDLIVDSDDVLWCVTAGEVSRFDPKGFSGISSRDGLTTRQSDAGKNSATSVLAIEPDGQAGYWLGTEWGGVFRLETRDGDQVSATEMAPTEYVSNIQRAADGTVWLGAASGIYKRVDGRCARVLERTWVVAFNRDQQGQLWFGHAWYGGGVSRYNPITGEQTTFTRAQGLPDDFVWVIEPASDGKVWIGTSSGLGLFQNGQVEDVGKRLGLPSGAVRMVRQNGDGALWAGGEKGLYRLQGTNFVSVTSTNVAPIEGVVCWTRTPDGILWIGTHNRGLLGYDGQVLTQLDTRDGLVGDTVYSLMPDADGSLLIGSRAKGLGHYRRTKTPPSVRFIDVKIKNQTFSEFENLPSTEIGRPVTVRYQEIDLKTHLEKRQFVYRVEGPAGEKPLSGITKDRRFEWTPRKGGAYTFEVQAVDRDLNYSKPVRFTFRATTPWYANAWITVPGGGAFGGLAIWAFVARALYVRQRREAERLREQMLLQERESRAALEDKTRQLEVAKESAESANRAKSTFLANMSHEIRTPLNAVLGYAQILQRDERLEDDQRQAIDTIDRGGSHLLKVINEILDLSKIEAGQMELVETDFDLAELIGGLSEMFEWKCREKGLRWECGLATENAEGNREELTTKSTTENTESGNDLTTDDTDHTDEERTDDPSDPHASASSAVNPSDPSLRSLRSLRLDPIPVRGDEIKLRQVLINLLGNAVKFTDTGSVTLRVVAADVRRLRSPGPEGAGQVRASSRRLLRFEVSDTGPGIPPALCKKIFDPFTQGTEGRLKGGTGLGLTIAQRHVRLMGGTLELDSEPAKGSRFFFTLKLAPASAELQAKSKRPYQRARRLRAGTQVRALIADDVKENSDVLSWFLKDLGLEAKVVEDGEQVLEELLKASRSVEANPQVCPASDGRAELPVRPAISPNDGYDIAFMDIRMPKLTGFQVAQKLLGERGAGRVKLVAISASVLKHEQSLYAEAGFDAFVPKPFRFEELVECLETQLGVSFEYEAETVQAGKTSKPRPLAGTLSSEDLIDGRRLDQLFGSDLDRRRRYMESYLGHTSSQLGQLREALQSGNAAEVELVAHRCYGASGNLGIQAMARAMERLEAVAVSKDLNEAARLLAEAEQVFGRVTESLRN
jgi:signal transduction histidine kinase/ligand-binding sensor domain-containing protein/CheY-like chemotaxis protein